MRAIWICPALLGMLVLTGCSTVAGGPPRVADRLSVTTGSPGTRAADVMLDGLAAAIQKDCFAIPDAATLPKVQPGAKLRRDQLVKLYVVAVDRAYYPFESALLNDNRQINFLGTIASLGLATAGSAASGHTARVLAAANAGVIGERVAFTREFLFDKTVSALQNQMRANRSTVAERIYKGLARPPGEYTACDALRDLLAYEQAGTLADALSGIAQTTSQEADAAKDAELTAKELTYATSPLAQALQTYFGPEDEKLMNARVGRAINAMSMVNLKPPAGMTPRELFGRILADEKLVTEQRALALAVLMTETDITERTPIVDALK